MGNISIVISVAPALGPTLSGIILNQLTWRWMFWLVLPISLGALLLGGMRISNVSTPKEAPIDLPSVILSAIGFGGLVYGLNKIGDVMGEAGPIARWVPLAFGAVALIAFIWRQLSLQRADRALLDLRTLASKNFAITVVSLAICMMSLFGAFILLPIYMQHVLGLDPLKTGLLLLPGGLIMGLMAPPVGRFYDRHGPTFLTVPGTFMVSAVLWFMTTMNEQTSTPALMGAHIVLSVGLALTFTPLFTAGLGSLPPNLYAHGSALVGTVQQLAGAAGAALFIALMSLQTATLLAGGLSPVAATAGGIHTAFWWGAVISMFAIVAVFFVKKPVNGEAPHA
ncbi:putative multidrug resistance protein EmrY [compost metagenome]